MSAITTFMKGAALGSALMYFFDPARGRARRALARDRAAAMLRRAGCWLDMAARDLGNRAEGVVHSVRSWSEPAAADDATLEARVRSVLGRCTSHPRAIQVSAHDGRIALRGPILSREVAGLVAALRAVRGVRGIDNQLDAHDQPGDVSALQGGIERRGRTLDAMQENWAPATRLLAAAGGVALMMNCLARRKAGDALLGTIGFGLFVRAAANRPLAHLLQPERERREKHALPEAAHRPPVARIEGTPMRDDGRPGGGHGRVDVVGTRREEIRIDPNATEGHPGYEESGDSEIIPAERFTGKETSSSAGGGWD